MQACNNYHTLDKSHLPKYGLNILTTKDKTESYITDLINSYFVQEIANTQLRFSGQFSQFSALNSPLFYQLSHIGKVTRY